MTASNQLKKLIKDLEKLKPSMKHVGPLNLPVILPKGISQDPSNLDGVPQLEMNKHIDIFWARDFIGQLAEMEGVPEPAVDSKDKRFYQFVAPNTIGLSNTLFRMTAALGGIWIENTRASLAHEFKHYLQHLSFEETKEGKKWVKYQEENKERLEREAREYGIEHSGLSSQSEIDKFDEAEQMILMEYTNKEYGPFKNNIELVTVAEKNAPWIGYDIKRFLEESPQIAEKYENPLEYVPSMKERFEG